jgi:hypothetical protein
MGSLRIQGSNLGFFKRFLLTTPEGYHLDEQAMGQAVDL